LLLLLLLLHEQLLILNINNNAVFYSGDIVFSVTLLYYARLCSFWLIISKHTLWNDNKFYG